MFRESCSPNTVILLKTMQNHVETSSLNFLLRKQSSQAFSVTTRGSCSALVLLQNILRTNWSWFLGLALLPFHRSSVGSAAAEERLQWLFGHSRESWTLSLSQLPAKAAAVPRALGWRCTGHSQPWPHSLSPSTLCIHRKAKSQTGLPFVPS